VLFENRASINLTCVLRKAAAARDFVGSGAAGFPRVMGNSFEKSPRYRTRVVSELYAPVYRFALVPAESETEAADLTQETFLILCRQYKQVREPEKVRGDSRYAGNTDRYGNVAAGARQGEAERCFNGNRFARKTQGAFAV
jgi:hypothetical protein